MTSQEKSKKAFVSVVQMAEMLDLSKSRFYTMIKTGIFPQPVRHASCKRPIFDFDLQQKCLDIRQTGIGHNGSPVLFNRKRRKPTQPKARQDQQPISEEQAELVEALKSLGLTASREEVQTVVRELYPDGWKGIDEGEVVRRVFLKLREGK
jgi:hypothetical protein